MSSTPGPSSPKSYASSIVKSYGNEVAELIQAQYALGCEVDAVEASGDPVKEEPVVATQLNGSGAGTMTSPSPVGVGTTLVPFAIMKHVYRKWLDGSISEATQAQVYGQQWLEAFQAILEHLVRWDSCSVFDVGELDGEFGGGES